MTPAILNCHFCESPFYRDADGKEYHVRPTALTQQDHSADETHAPRSTFETPADLTGIKPASAIPQFVAVVHVRHPAHAAEETRKAIDNGAGGVCLIQHDMDAALLMASIQHTRHAVGDAVWLGANFLGRSTLAARSYCLSAKADACWFDHYDRRTNHSVNSRMLRQFCEQIDRNHELHGVPLLGGVGFKYCPEPTDLRLDLQCAATDLDVVMTSGDATGQAASVDKVRQYYEILQEIAADRQVFTPLGLASGVSAENIHLYHPYVKHFFVASSISESWDVLDAGKIAKLRSRLDELNLRTGL